MLVEALSADEERVRALLLISSGKSSSTTSLDSPFAHLIRFVERAEPLPYWTAGPAEQRERPVWEKDLGLCKAAAIKAIVTVAGEDSQMDVLWGQNDPSGGWFVEKMLSWIKEYPAAKESRNQDERDDLVICATLCLANLARRGKYFNLDSMFGGCAHPLCFLRRGEMCCPRGTPNLYRPPAHPTPRCLYRYQAETRRPGIIQAPCAKSAHSRASRPSWNNRSHHQIQGLESRIGYGRHGAVISCWHRKAFGDFTQCVNSPSLFPCLLMHRLAL